MEAEQSELISPISLKLEFILEEEFVDDIKNFFNNIEKKSNYSIVKYGSTGIGDGDDEFEKLKSVLEDELTYISYNVIGVEFGLYLENIKKNCLCSITLRAHPPYLCTLSFMLFFREHEGLTLSPNNVDDLLKEKLSYLNINDFIFFMNDTENVLFSFIQNSDLNNILEFTWGYMNWNLSCSEEILINDDKFIEYLELIKTLFQEQDGPKNWFKIKIPNYGLPIDEKYGWGSYSKFPDGTKILQYFTPCFKEDIRIERYKNFIFPAKDGHSSFQIYRSLEKIMYNNYRFMLANIHMLRLENIVDKIKEEYNKINVSNLLDVKGDNSLNILTDVQLKMHTMYKNKDESYRMIESYNNIKKLYDFDNIDRKINESQIWENHYAVFEKNKSIENAYNEKMMDRYKTISMFITQYEKNIKDLINIMNIKTSHSILNTQSEILNAINQNIESTEKTKSRLDIVSLILGVFVFGEIASNMIIWCYTSTPTTQQIHNAILLMAIIIIVASGVLYASYYLVIHRRT